MDHDNDTFFQVSVKGMFFDDQHRLMMIQEKDGIWELPGGRIQKGEEFIETLKRECLEETGLECEVLDTEPSIVYPAIDIVGRGRIMVFYKIDLGHLQFTPSDECVAIAFFSKDDIGNLSTNPQIKPLLKYL